ncbi:hypothetical protein Tco_0641107 [Tanacetum coccineum]
MGLLKSHDDYFQSSDSRLKILQQRLTSFQGLESQLSGLKKQVAELNDKVTAFDAAFVKAKAKGKEQKKKMKSLSKSLDQFTAEAARLASDQNQVRRSNARKGDQIAAAQTYPDDIYALIDGYKNSLAEKDFKILRLKASPHSLLLFSEGELLSLAASVVFEGRHNMDRTQKQLVAALKKISHFVPGAQGRLIEATPLVATTAYLFLNNIADHSARPLYALLELKPDKLTRLTVVLAPPVAGVSPLSLKESTVTLDSSSVELFLKDVPPSSIAATEQPPQEHNEEWLDVMVDTTDEEMVDATSDKSAEVLVQGIIHQVCEDMSQKKDCAPPNSLDVPVIAPVDAGDAAAAPLRA